MSVDVVADLESRVAAAAFELGVDDVEPAVRRSDFTDFQADLAMGLARRLGRPPRDVAEALVAAGTLDDVCAEVAVAGPGFLNLTLAPAYLHEQLRTMSADARFGLPSPQMPATVVVDYSAPNVAKEMHVGHLRSTVIGDALVRVLERLGHRVVRQNHVGDWGTPFGMLVEHLVDLGEEGAVAELSLGDLGGFYQVAREKFDGDPTFTERARQRVVALQAGDAETLRLWRLLVEASERYFERVYDLLDVTLGPDDLAPESRYNADLPEVADALAGGGLAHISEGALCAFPDGFVRRDGEPLPLIVRKQDGGFGYAATDLAAVRHRVGTLGADWLVYVVGAPQAQHLQMVFQVARDAGWLPHDVRVDHVAFGSVLGEDGRMLKTRAGTSVKLIDLLQEAIDRARPIVDENNPDMSTGDRDGLAHAIGIGAVKYADLSSDRIKDYTFAFDRMLAMSGNTAPYLQYAHARVCSILARAGGDPAAGVLAVDGPAERELALTLLGFGRAVRDTAETLEPHRLCGYLHDLASAYTSFYEACPVLRADTDAQRTSRLHLCDLTRRVLADGLALLGIRAPERM